MRTRTIERACLACGNVTTDAMDVFVKSPDTAVAAAAAGSLLPVGVLADQVAADPTRPRHHGRVCARCGNDRAVVYQPPLWHPEDLCRVLLVCDDVKCAFTWQVK